MTDKKFTVQKMQYYIFLLALVVGLFFYFNQWSGKAAVYEADADQLVVGKQLFVRHCASCHDLQIDGIGPSLGGVTDISSHASLMDFIKNPSGSKDPRAIRLQEIYSGTMPPFNYLDETEINQLLSFIHHESRLKGLKARKLEEMSKIDNRRYAPPVKKSNLRITLEQFAQLPRSSDRPADKGIATLRAHPAGDGHLWVSDQMGVIYQIYRGQIDTFLHLSKRMEDFIFEPGIGTGLGSFVFHPDYLANGFFYTTHTEKYLDKSAINEGDFPDTVGVGLQWVLTEWKDTMRNTNVSFSGTSREILRVNTPTTAHGMQDISFSTSTDQRDPDYGMLYLGVGDGGSNNIKRPDLCHDPKSLLGTVLRIDPQGVNGKNDQYGLPPDNPFIDASDPLIRKEIWAYGFRNPHRMSWNGRQLIVADIGEANVEELNFIVKGGDYGWSIREGFFGISTVTDLKKVFAINGDERRKYREPYAQYDHQDGRAISGGFVYDGSIENLRGKYFFGDIVTGDLFYVNLDSSLNDPSIYRTSVLVSGESTSMQALCGSKRVHLRIGYDPYQQDLYVMTKGDAKIWHVAAATTD
jgi:mono/diheme cytochrome c family protein